jgi:hypothetical protein
MNNPQVGQLMYREESTTSAVLFFVDSEPEGNTWPYTQVALIYEDEGVVEVYIEPEAGMMPQDDSKPATDEDIKRFIDMVSKTGNAEEQFAQWLGYMDTEDYSTLLSEEKARLENLIKNREIL